MTRPHVDIYYRPPGNDSRNHVVEWFYNGIKPDFGHIFIEVSDAKGKKTSLDFWDDGKVHTPDDARRNEHQHKTIFVSEARADQIRHAIEHVARHPHDYHPLNNSCVSNVLHVLREAGIQLPDSITPRGVWESIIPGVDWDSVGGMTGVTKDGAGYSTVGSPPIASLTDFHPLEPGSHIPGWHPAFDHAERANFIGMLDTDVVVLSEPATVNVVFDWPSESLSVVHHESLTSSTEFFVSHPNFHVGGDSFHTFLADQGVAHHSATHHSVPDQSVPDTSGLFVFGDGDNGGSHS